ncbi:MAG: endopeptidase La [Thermoflexales bacterium]|nr:endopeptidase La [Thermoflexales bacterium]MDW8293517.1 endopeptidase La [Anaerolineae bacterium]
MTIVSDRASLNWMLGASFGTGLPASEAEQPPLPEVLEAAVIPLKDGVVYPHLVVPLTLSSERAMLAAEAARGAGQAVLIALKRETIQPLPSDLYEVGTLVQIGRVLNLPNGAMSLLVQGRARVRVLEWVQATPFLVARVQVLKEPAAQGPAAEALMRAVLALFENVVNLSDRIPEEALVYALNIHEPSRLADYIAPLLPIDVATQQALLELIDPQQRLQKLTAILANELDVLELEDRIHERAQSEVDKSQREYYLREQLRSIQAELGQLDSSVSEVNALRARAEQKQLPDVVRKRVEHEIARLEQMPSMAPEVSITRDYIEWLLELPWRERTEDRLDVAYAERVLNQRHYGLTKAKERILEHIAVCRLRGSLSHGPILCFVGPPGTGKTSLARSIAEALGRRFVRVSLGGVRDEAEIRGHRRTYVGALPGRILQTMRRAGVVNPVFVLDEIDKLGLDFRGDPSAALLEVLDPEQNAEFEDHYLDLPYDLSHVMWITTANTLYDIPPALRDRLEVIEFSGYIEEEKVQIARRFLIPRQMSENGLGQAKLTFSEGALRRIIREYTYEAGVRNLERAIASVCRKVARRVAEGKRHPQLVTPKMLDKMLGQPLYDYVKLEPEDQVGMALGVAWDEGGGDVIQVEATVMEGKGELILTGQLGDVMQESAKAALSYARSRAQMLGVARKTFEKSDIHIHVPEGAIAKDGPSAGITMATALISALTRIPVRRDVAMTGEITLRGRVLPIGGLKEKAMAAHRAGVRTFILPKKNARDLEEVPRRIRREMNFVQVSSMDEVLPLALVRMPAPLAEAEEAAANGKKPRAQRARKAQRTPSA